MKKMLLFVIAIFACTLFACGNGGEEGENGTSEVADEGIDETVGDEETRTENPNDDGVGDTDGTDANDDQTAADGHSPYAFTSFELDVDIEQDDDAIEVDYDEESDEIEASYEHKPNGINLYGDEAIEELNGIFRSFEFDENTPDEEVIQTVMEAFDIPDDAVEFDLEIEFANGVEKEYRR